MDQLVELVMILELFLFLLEEEGFGVFDACVTVGLGSACGRPGAAACPGHQSVYALIKIRRSAERCVRERF